MLDVEGNELFWRQVKHELSDARHARLLLAVIVSFTAWVITHFPSRFG